MTESVINSYKAQEFYILEPHENWVKPGMIPIEKVVERVYGKPYSSLHGCQYDDDEIGNDTEKIYRLADEEDYEQALFDLDGGQWQGEELTYNPAIYLGYDLASNKPVFKTGMTQINYWLSIKVSENPEDITVKANPEPGTDLENAVFESRFFADRAFSPSLRLILADLIRREEIPRGNFIFHHWW